MKEKVKLSKLRTDDILNMSKSELGVQYLSEFYDDRNQPQSLLPIINRCVPVHGSGEDAIRRLFSEAVQWLCENALIAEYLDGRTEKTYFVTDKGVRYITGQSNIALTP